MRGQRCAKLDVVIYLDHFIGGAVIVIYSVTVTIYYIACCDMIKENVNFNCTLNVLFSQGDSSCCCFFEKNNLCLYEGSNFLIIC